MWVWSLLGLSWCLRWCGICLQGRRLGFDSWVGKIPWGREWLATPVFLPGEFHEQRRLAGYSPWGHKEWDTTEQLSFLHWLGNLDPACRSCRNLDHGVDDKTYPWMKGKMETNTVKGCDTEHIMLLGDCGFDLIWKYCLCRSFIWEIWNDIHHVLFQMCSCFMLGTIQTLGFSPNNSGKIASFQGCTIELPL